MSLNENRRFATRAFKRALRLAKIFGISNQLRFARLHRKCRSKCSCNMCGNPRRHTNKKKDKLHISEKRHNEGFDDLTL